MHSGDRSRSEDGEKGRIAVVLVCLSCSREQTVHIPREKAGRYRIYWECFQCQDTGAPQPGSRPKTPRPGRDGIKQ